MTDSLHVPFMRLEHSEKISLSWAVEFSSKGIDPLHAAWLASGNGATMLRFVRERLLLRKKTDDFARWQTITNEKLASHIAGALPYYIRLYGLNNCVGAFTSKEGAKKAADAMRKVFAVDDVITLSELLAMPSER